MFAIFYQFLDILMYFEAFIASLLDFCDIYIVYVFCQGFFQLLLQFHYHSLLVFHAIYKIFIYLFYI